MNFELFFSISAHRLPCNFHARTCMIAHEKSPRIYGYIDYSTNIPACQLFFSINFHITFIILRICKAHPARKPSFQGQFFGTGIGRNARRRRKGCKNRLLSAVFAIAARGSGGAASRAWRQRRASDSLEAGRPSLYINRKRG